MRMKVPGSKGVRTGHCGDKSTPALTVWVGSGLRGAPACLSPTRNAPVPQQAGVPATPHLLPSCTPPPPALPHPLLGLHIAGGDGGGAGDPYKKKGVAISKKHPQQMMSSRYLRAGRSISSHPAVWPCHSSSWFLTARKQTR